MNKELSNWLKNRLSKHLPMDNDNRNQLVSLAKGMSLGHMIETALSLGDVFVRKGSSLFLVEEVSHLSVFASDQDGGEIEIPFCQIDEVLPS